MYQKLNSLIFILLLACNMAHAEYALQETRDPIEYAEFEMQQDNSYQEWVAFEQWLKEDTTPDIMALASGIERDLLLIFQVAAIAMDHMIEHTAALVIEQCKSSPQLAFQVYQDMLNMIDAINYVSGEFIFIEDERDAMQAEAYVKYVVYIKNRMELYFALLDTVAVACGDHERLTSSFVQLDGQNTSLAFATIQGQFVQLSPLSQKVFLNGLCQVRMMVPDTRARFYSMLDKSVSLQKITNCSDSTLMSFVDNRVGGLGYLYNQIVQHYMIEDAHVFEGKVLDELTQEDIAHMVQVVRNIAHCSQAVAGQMLNGDAVQLI